MAEEGNIVRGPDFLSPVPKESIGQYIYRHLLINDKQYDAHIDAETEERLSFQQFLEVTCRLAQCLDRAGYSRGDVISVCSENNIYFLQTVVAAMYLGVTIAPINQSYSKGELLHTMNISKPKLIFCSNNTFNKFVNLRGLVPFLEKIVVFNLREKILGVEDFHEFVNRISDKYLNVYNFKPTPVNPSTDVAAILCSSGTTGMPKGVMITHENLVVKMEHKKDIRFYNPCQNATALGLMPFFHGFGFVTSIENLIRGYRMVIISRFKEDFFLATLEKYKITHLWIVPAIMIFFAKSDLVKKYDLSSIIELGCGAAPLSKETEITALKRLGNVQRFVQGYGLTEATFAVTVPPVIDTKRGSSGKLLAGLFAKVRHIETNKSLGPNEVGELLFKGPIVMKGYLGNEEETRNSFDKDGWLKTGDLGYYDEEGFFYIVDRLKELIKYKGFQVPPAELEKILLSNPKIKDAAVVGIPDDLCGELPMAFVIKQPNAQITEEEVKVFVANQVSKQKQLHGGVRFVDFIPKNASGKILRRELKKMIPKHKL